MMHVYPQVKLCDTWDITQTIKVLAVVFGTLLFWLLYKNLLPPILCDLLWNVSFRYLNEVDNSMDLSDEVNKEIESTYLIPVCLNL